MIMKKTKRYWTLKQPPMTPSMSRWCIPSTRYTSPVTFADGFALSVPIWPRCTSVFEKRHIYPARITQSFFGITYLGANYCYMTPKQEVDAILKTYLPNAGFCINGANITYCGNNLFFADPKFTQSTFDDDRSVMLKPTK